MTGNSPYEAPDGGWAWLVCFGSFTLQALTMGVTYTFGIIFVDLLEYFKSSESTTAWIGSIQPALLYFTGILAGPLISRLGWRKVAICGSFISATGFATSALAPNIYVLYLTYGVLTGVGNGCMYVTSMVCVQHYFSSRRAMATGLAVSGSGVGLLIFGVLSPALLSALGWRWTLVVESGITLVVGCTCASLYRPLPTKTVTTVYQQASDKTPLLDQEDETISQTSVAWQYSSSACEKSLSYGSLKSASMDFRMPRQISPIQERSESKDSCSSNSDTQEPSGCCLNNGGSKCCTVFKEIFDLSLFCNPVFALFGFSIMMFGFGYHVPYTYTPERAIHLGFSQKKSSFLLSVIGIANIGFRLLLGWVADKSTRFRFYYAGMALCLAGILNMTMVFFTTYPLLVVYSVFLERSQVGSYTSLFPVILVDLLGLSVLEKSMGQALAVSSVAFLFASPMSGFIIDQTGSLVMPFYVVGAAELIGGLAYFTIKCFTPKVNEHENPHTTETLEFRTNRNRTTSFLRISGSFS